jgi:bifunctional non-homologous end joining protein LigD
MPTQIKSIPFRVSPMLATLVAKPFHRPGWIYEEKYDGIRILAYKEGKKVSLVSRNGKDRTAGFAGIARAIAGLEAETLLLDGELVIFDTHRVSHFQLLQKGKGSPRYAVFDCLYHDGEDLRQQPLMARRQVLEKAVRPSDELLLSVRLAENGMAAFEVAKRRGFEGLIAKNTAAAYEERRSAQWLKVKVNRQQEFVIGGYTAPAGSRLHFGALLLGVYDRGKLMYVGKAGTGFDDLTLTTLKKKFQPLVRKTSPFASDVREKNVTFVAPRIVAQISFTEWTGDGKLRHPVFLGLRDDKNPEDVTREEP